MIYNTLYDLLVDTDLQAVVEGPYIRITSYRDVIVSCDFMNDHITSYCISIYVVCIVHFHW